MYKFGETKISSLILRQCIEIPVVYNFVHVIPSDIQSVLEICKKWKVTDIQFYDDNTFTLFTEDFPKGWYRGKTGNYLLVNASEYQDEIEPVQYTPEVFTNLCFDITVSSPNFRGISMTPNLIKEIIKLNDKIYKESLYV